MRTMINEPIDLRERALVFSKDILKFSKTINHNPYSQPVISQLIRCSTSVGANFVEAKNSGSKKDFRNKVFISKKEAAETEYWLQICEEYSDSIELKRLQAECHEIILILQSIINTLAH